jgi:D-3-phosphoglycerate dehydrogenase
MPSTPLILQTHHPWVGQFSDRDALYAIEREALAQAGLSLTIVGEDPRDLPDDLLRGADAVLRRGWLFPRELLERMTACKIIVCPGIGFDGIDLAAATALGIVVANVPYATSDEVATHAVTLLLACARKLHVVDRALRAGRYDWRLAIPVHSLRGATAGFVAFGNSARSAARKLQAFGIRLLAYDPYVTPAVAQEHGVQWLPLPDLLRQSDFVLVHAPLTSETHHLLDESALALMKPSAVLVQVSRGGVVDQQALARALQAGRLAGAGLDVLEVEPPDPDNPLLHMDNVLVTPHYAGYSEEGFRDQKVSACDAIVRVLSGRWPRWVVNPGVQPRTPLQRDPEV